MRNKGVIEMAQKVLKILKEQQKIIVGTIDDLATLRQLWEQCFEDVEAYVTYYFENRVKPECCLLFNVQDKTVAGLHLNPYTVNFCNTSFKTSYFVGVATLEAYRGQGFMKLLMESALRYLKEKGEKFSLLMPIDSRIYERFDFRFIQDNTIFECESSAILVDELHHKEIIPMSELKNKRRQFLLERKWKQTNFELFPIRSEKELDIWEKGFECEGGSVAYLENGYVAYYPTEPVQVTEIFYDSQMGLENCLSFIKTISHGAQAQINTYGRDPIKSYIAHSSKNKRICKPYMMARILDVTSVLQTIWDNSQLTENLKLSIEVMDTIISENSGCYEIYNGLVSLQEEQCACDLRIGIGSLTQLVFGYMTLNEVVLSDSEVILCQHEALWDKLFRQRVLFFNEVV